MTIYAVWPVNSPASPETPALGKDGVVKGRRGGIPLSCESGRCGWLPSPGRIMIRSGRRSRQCRQALGVGTAETVRKWVRQAEIDAGARAGMTSQDSAGLRKLRAGRVLCWLGMVRVDFAGCW